MEHLTGEFQAAIAQQVDAAAVHHRYHSITLPGLGLQAGLVPEAALAARMAAFGIEAQLSGAAVLDVGAASGWNTFWCESKGAQVTALDNVPYADFLSNREALGSQARYLLGDIVNQSPATIGSFDITICFGVLYHSRHPLKALEALCSVTREVALIESFVIDPPATLAASQDIAPLLEFYPSDELGGQLDNWTGPTAACLEAFVLAAGFCRCERVYYQDRRLALKAFRKYPLPTQAADERILLSGVISNLSKTSGFRSGVDEFLEIYFRCPQETLADLRFEVDGYGLPIQKLFHNAQGEGQALARLPDWVEPGGHQLTIRRDHCASSGEAKFIRRASPPAEEVRFAQHRIADPVSLDIRGFQETIPLIHCKISPAADHTLDAALVVTVGVPLDSVLLSDGTTAYPPEYAQPGLDGATLFRFRAPLAWKDRALFAVHPASQSRTVQLYSTQLISR